MLPLTHVNGTNVLAPAMRDAQLNTRASVRRLAESASPISISARFFVGLAVLARLAIKSAVERGNRTPMPRQSDFGVGELHETIRGGERVLIRRARLKTWRYIRM